MAGAGGRRNEMKPEAAGKQAVPEVTTARENALWTLIDCRDRAQGKPRALNLYPLASILSLLLRLMRPVANRPVANEAGELHCAEARGCLHKSV